ncbi:hypothetical protein [uncultured Roseobacter sp.]|uniref:hypothetical protein n=1 Tax=uncultured Roseobacter sp. TaxID=114847 RepID=UPI0026294F63|nr:hypothetical protein [uncultured Roseobacter sp.]
MASEVDVFDVLRLRINPRKRVIARTVQYVLEKQDEVVWIIVGFVLEWNNGDVTEHVELDLHGSDCATRRYAPARQDAHPSIGDQVDECMSSQMVDHRYQTKIGEDLEAHFPEAARSAEQTPSEDRSCRPSASP